MKSSPLRQLAQLAASERKEVGLVIIYGIAIGLFSLAVPIAAQSLVNTVSFTSLYQPIVVLSMLVFFTLGAASVLRVVQTTLVEIMQRRLFARVAMDLAYRFPRVEFESIRGNQGPSLVNRVLEVVTIQKASALLMLDGMGIVLQAALGSILLGFYHPFLLAFDVLLLASMVATVWLPLRRALKTSLDESKAKYATLDWLETLVRHPVTFRLYAGPQLALRRTDEIAYTYVSNRATHYRFLLAQISGTMIVQTLASALLLGLGSVLVIQKQLTLGQLIAAEIVVTTVVNSFSKFGKYLESFYDLAASVDKLGHLFDLPLEPSGADELKVGKDPMRLRLSRVGFTLKGDPRARLSDVSLEISPGSQVELCGVSGSGKTTLLELLLGLRRPTGGSIEFDGLDTRDLKIESVRDQIGYVRDVELFDGDVFDNVRVGREWITNDQVRETLRALDLLGDINALPEGLATKVSGVDAPLTRDQGHLLMLARAIVHKPRLLIIDEALDTLSEASRAKALAILTQPNAPWTLICATNGAKPNLKFAQTVILSEGELVNDRKGPTA